MGLMRMLAETHLSYSSLMLFAMSYLTLALSIFFRLKHRKLNSLPMNLSANVFDKTFNIFNPYNPSIPPKHRRIVQSYLPILDVIINLAPWILVPLVFLIYAMSSDFLISLILLLVCLHLMFVDFASETHQTSKNIIKAVHDEADLGVGDIELVQKLKRILPRLSNYYLVLSILFLTLAVTKNYIWSSLLWLFFQPIRLIFEVSELAGFLGWQVAVFLYGAIVFIVLTLAWKIKSKILDYMEGTP